MNHLINYLFYIFFGILPSLIWLNFYLRKDVRPEPKSMILKIFFLGLLSTLPAFFLEIACFEEFKKLNFSSFTILILNIFLGVALIEESLKFLVVKEKVLNNPEFDEPVDAMIYMIIAALGFAAGENILILLPLKSDFFYEIVSQVLGISILRFLGATFLHALSGATLGFFIGLSFFKKEKRPKLVFLGLTLSTLLHGLYNFSIISPALISLSLGGIIIFDENSKILFTVLLLVTSAIFISLGFTKLKNKSSLISK